jgi:hypothetical protein
MAHHRKLTAALRNGAPFAELPAPFKRLQAMLLKKPGGDRAMVEILALVLHYDEQVVLAAVEAALGARIIVVHGDVHLPRQLLQT